MVEKASSTTEATEKYHVKIELLAKELRKSMNRAEKLEEAILLYLDKADRYGTMTPSNLRILREAVHSR